MSLTDLSPASVRAYDNGVRSFITWAERGGFDRPGQVTRLVLRRYLAYLTTRGLARQTITQRASALRRYFSWLGRKGVLDSDPTIALSARTGGSRLPRPVSRSDLEVILDHPPARGSEVADEVRLRDDAALELLYGSGLRVSELCGLSEADLDLRGGWATVWGKGSKQRRVPISDSAARAVRKWVDEGRPLLARAGSPVEALFLNARGQRLARATYAVYLTDGRRRPLTRMLCGIVSRLTYWTAALTLELCRSSWAMQACAPPRSTRT